MYYKVVYFPSEEKKQIYLRLKSILNSQGAIEGPEDDAEYIFIIGGDGSFLHFAREYAFKDKKLVGIKAGNTAFLATLELDNLCELRNLKWKPIDLLRIDIEQEVYYAVNDIYIAGDLFLETSIYIENHLLERFRGSGLLFSTRNGSTGKNKSIGGPILLTDQNLWIMRELGACCTNKMNSLNSSIILSSSNNVKIINEKNCRIYIDGIDLKTSVKSLNISLVKSISKVADLGFISYIDRLRDTFLIENGQR